MNYLSTKGRYGLRALIDLAVLSSNNHVPLKTIADRQNISEIYLEQVFSILRKNKIVKSVKGSNGGYLLNISPTELKIKTILEVLEGNISILGDKKEELNTDETSLTNSIKINLWDKIDNAIEEILMGKTLEELVIEYKKINNEIDPMYYI